MHESEDSVAHEQQGASTTDDPDRSQASSIPSVWLLNAGTNSRCANCGQPRRETFCSSCGQKHQPGRLAFWALVKELFTRLFNVERGLLHTFLSLLRHPGLVARDYVCGKHRPYVNPLAYFFIGAAAQMLALWLSESEIRDGFVEAFNSSNTAAEARGATPPLERLEKFLGADYSVSLANIYLSTMKQAYTYAALFFFSLPFSVLLMVFHRVSGDKFRLAETAVFSLFLTGQMLIVTAMILPISMRISPTVQTILGPSAYVVITAWGHRQFFRPTWVSRLMTATSLIISVAIFVTSILSIFGVSIIIHVLANQAAN